MFYWTVLQGSSILERDDNPRLVEAELRIERGRILDANNVVLAETKKFADGLRRIYQTPSIGPTVGYYSFRHGTAGIENSFDSLLRGETEGIWARYWRHNTLHKPQIGRDVRTTLDVRLQRTADALLGDQKGAIILFTLPDRSIEAMVSHPNYDPNLLDEQFDSLIANEDAPLLNRVTQGNYQPGLILQPFLLAGAVEADRIKLDEIVTDGTDALMVNNTTLHCAGVAEDPITWVDALQQRCPASMIQIAHSLGEDGLRLVFENFGFLDPPVIPLETESAGGPPFSDLELAAIGQDTLALSPLQVAMALASLADDGQLRNPTLVESIQDSEGRWQAYEQPTGSVIAVSPATAKSILDALPTHENITEHSVVVLSGPEGSMNSWYLGLVPRHNPHFGVVVVVEGSDESTTSQQVGRSLLNIALTSD